MALREFLAAAADPFLLQQPELQNTCVLCVYVVQREASSPKTQFCEAVFV